MKPNLHTEVADMLAKERENRINWSDIKNWWPIIGLCISVVFMFAQLERRLALVEQKLTDLITIEKDIYNKYSSVEDRYGNLAIRVNIIESKMGIK